MRNYLINNSKGLARGRSTAEGFSTLELMIAFALMSVIFTGVILSHFGSAYWAIAAQTSNEGLYKAKTRLEELRAVVKKDFRMASSSVLTKVSDTSCDAGGLCYYIKTDILDLSSCSKYVTANVSWQVQGYPTTTTSLFTNLTDANEAVNLGGDCPLVAPAGTWTSSTLFSSADVAGVVPSGMDTLSGVTYITSNTAPYFSISNGSSFTTFANAFAPMDPLNSVEVARDVVTGRTYAYAAIASTSVQLEVLDVTDTNNPTSVAKLQLSGVDKTGSFPQGWRLAYYDRKIYITVRETTGPEFHIVDVSNPANPTELGSRELNTSVYGLVVRDVKQGSTNRRIVFLATSMDSKELMVLDATTPTSIAELTGAATDLSGDYDGRSVFFAGNTVYVGRIQNTGAELYALDAKNLFTASAGLSIVGGSGREIGGAVESIRVSEPFVFVGNSKSGSQLQIFTTVDGTLSASELSHFSAGGFSGGIDLEGTSVYLTSQNTPKLRVIHSQ